MYDFDHLKCDKLCPRVPYDQWCKNHIYIFCLAADFEPPNDLPFDIRHAHALKQREVLAVYNVLKARADLIKEAWVIGSSVRPTCEYHSDLDLIVSTTIPAHQMDIELSLLFNEVSKCTKNGADIIRLEELELCDMIFYETVTGLKII